MGASLNNCQFIGNLGRDPETRYTTSGSAVCNFSIACSEQWKDKATGDKKEKTEWVRCTAFDRTAEVAGEYLKVGSRCYVQGRMQTRKWTDKEGVEKYTTEIVVDRLILLDGKRDSEDSGRTRSNDRAQAPAGKPAGKKTDDFDDDIPF